MSSAAKLLLDAEDDRGGGRADRRADSQEAVEADRRLAPLNVTDVAAVHPRPRGQRLLREAGTLPRLAEDLTNDRGRRVVPRHNPKLIDFAGAGM